MFKKLLFSIAVLSSASQFIFAQAPIPNGGFESWTTGNPDNWGSSDKIVTSLGQPDPGGVEKDTLPANVYAGSSSVRITTKTITVPLVGTQTVPGVVSLGTLGFSFTTFSPVIAGIAYTSRPDSISFAAKYTKAVGSTDTGGVIVTLTRWGGGQRNIVANTIVRITDVANFKLFTAKIVYQSALAPDTLLIQGLSGLSQNATDGSVMWLDSLRVIGQDTVFKAYISPFFNRTVCAGDTVNFSTDNIPGNTFQWYKDGQPINGAIGVTYNATASGKYSVEVVSNATTYHSDSVTLTYVPLPTASFTLSTTSICINANPITLSGGTPGGGEYSGDGVDSQTGEFDPSTAGGAGPHDITYTYTDNNGCSADATKSIMVNLCAGIESVESGWNVNIYPNPATNFVTVETGQKLIGGRIEVYNIEGKLIMQENVTAAKSNINTQTLSAGNYTLRIVNTENKAVANGKVSITR